MKKSLFVKTSVVAISTIAFVSCGTRGDALNGDSTAAENQGLDSSAKALVDSTILDNPLIGSDSSTAITHGVPDEEKLDSLKKAKTEKKKKK